MKNTKENKKENSKEVSNKEIMNAFIEKSKKLEKDMNIESLDMKYQLVILKYKLKEISKTINKLTE